MPNINVSDKSSANSEPANDLSATVARVRWLMIISALTTAIAIAAVIGVVGYRFSTAATASSTPSSMAPCSYPRARTSIPPTISEGRIVVTFDLAGATEVRFFDLKTLQLVGQLHFGAQR